MNLKQFLFGVIWMSFGLYFLSMGIKLFKRKTVIFHTGQREKFGLLLFICFRLEMYFIARTNEKLTELVISMIILIFVFWGLVYRRLNDVMYKIYNVNEDDYKEILKKTLNENSIEFSITNDIIKTTKGTPTYIKFINNGFQIIKHKRLQNYQNFFKELETNLKKNEFINYDIVCVIPMLAGIVLTIMGISNLSTLL